MVTDTCNSRSAMSCGAKTVRGEEIRKTAEKRDSERKKKVERGRKWGEKKSSG